MNLVKALRIGALPRLSFAGAGGKTTAMFRLARQLPPPVLVTSTTHLATWQIDLADNHIYLQKHLDQLKIDDLINGHVNLVTGNTVEANRVAGLSPENLVRVFNFAEEGQVPLLIEADGSRQLPLKAPGEHEPPIPSFSDNVVVTAGLSAVGKPLSGALVHRAARFAQLSGLSSGDEITIEAISKVLKSPLGGSKNIPPRARRVALLNQADTPGLQASAHSLAKLLLPSFYSILISSLGPTAGSTQGVGREVFAVHEPVAGILLAAGGSNRLGEPKQLLPWKGRPMVYWVAKTALAAGMTPVVVVTGAYAQGVERALAALPVTLVHNADWQAGQSTSAQAGLRALPDEIGAALFLLSDQPQIPASLMRALVETHAQTLAPIVAPMIDGQRGNPVLFDRITFAGFSTLDGDVGGRKLFSRYPVSWVDWHDRSLLLDVDNDEDYRRLLELDC